MDSRITVWSGLWWGPILSTIVAALAVVFLTVAMGQGREFIPLAALFGSALALPVTMMLSSWVLFIPWKSRFLFFAGSFAVQSILVIAVMLYVHGYGEVHWAGEFILAPFFVLAGVVGPHVLLASMLWGVTMVGIVLAARARVRTSSGQGENGDLS